MLQQSTPQSLLNDAAWLDAAMADYLANGGSIATVPGYAPKPRPARFHPEPKPKRKPVVSEWEIKRKTDMDALKEYALQGFTLRYARICLGMTQLRAERLAKDLLDFGVEFREPRQRDEQ